LGFSNPELEEKGRKIRKKGKRGIYGNRKIRNYGIKKWEMMEIDENRKKWKKWKTIISP